MNIKDKIQQDLDKLHVSKEIELLRKALNTYMVEINNYLVSKGSMSFDYYGGCFHHHGYFDFTKAVLFNIDCNGELVTVRLFSGKSFNAEFKFYPKTNNLIYWAHSVKSTTAKEDIKNLIKLIESQTKELI